MHLAVVVALHPADNESRDNNSHRETESPPEASTTSVWDLESVVEVALEQPVELKPQLASPPPSPVEPTAFTQAPKPVQAPSGAKTPNAKLPGQAAQEPSPATPTSGSDSNPISSGTTTDPVARLSMAELGIGNSNPFLLGLGTPEGPGGKGLVGMPSAYPKGAAYRAHTRLQRSLSLGALQNDQKLGLGPEGPIVAALTEITYEAADTAANGQAHIRVTTNAQGQVVSAQLLSASSDTAAWERIARKLLARLKKERLRVAGRALTLDFQVKSREQLPSGRAPGVAVRAFGQDVKKGAGPNSSAIVILEPGFQEVPLYDSPNAPTVKVPTLVLLGVSADPVDIGATARRMVHVTLERMTIN